MFGQSRKESSATEGFYFLVKQVIKTFIPCFSAVAQGSLQFKPLINGKLIYLHHLPPAALHLPGFGAPDTDGMTKRQGAFAVSEKQVTPVTEVYYNQGLGESSPAQQPAKMFKGPASSFQNKF